LARRQDPTCGRCRLTWLKRDPPKPRRMQALGHSSCFSVTGGSLRGMGGPWPLPAGPGSDPMKFSPPSSGHTRYGFELPKR
jgi:hypothetical protein